jgi:hypothetical protein
MGHRRPQIDGQRKQKNKERQKHDWEITKASYDSYGIFCSLFKEAPKITEWKESFRPSRRLSGILMGIWDSQGNNGGKGHCHGLVVDLHRYIGGCRTVSKGESVELLRDTGWGLRKLGDLGL